MRIVFKSRRTQEELYYQHADKMFMLCYRYVKNEPDAGFILNGGFNKIFQNIEDNEFVNEQHLENWIKKIMVNECLMFLRNKKTMFSQTEEDNNIACDSRSDQNMVAEDYLRLINALPIGYKTVFNLYAIEGYNHKEISQELNISESTSRSQLARARALLKKWLNNNETENGK